MKKQFKNNQNFKIGILSVIYGIFSVGMVLINKHIYHLASQSCSIISPSLLLTIQCFESSFILYILHFIPRLGIDLKISKSDFKTCLIMNLWFMITMLSNNYTLKYLSVHMVTLLKCCSVVVTALGESLFLKIKISILSWISLIIIVLGSSFGLLTDIEFSLPGYIWMSISICSASLYIIITKKFLLNSEINHLTAAFWNNLLSVIFLSITSYKQFFSNQNIQCSLKVIILSLLSGIISLFLVFSTYSLLGHTSATSYSVVGAAKKVVQALFSFFLWPQSTTLKNIISVMVGISGSILYTYSKVKETKTEPNDDLPLLDDRSSSF